jgi:hypothetical protein
MAFWGELRARLEPFLDKSHLGLLRWVHLLALAYLMNQLFKWKPQWLTMGLPVWIIRMGQQSLPIFLCCMSLSYVGGIALDWLGRDATSIAMINLAGIGLMLATAKVLAWLDRKPWKLPADQYNQKQASTLDASADLRNIPYVWGKQALLLPFLICLAVFPMLLLQTTNSRGLSSPEIMVQAPPSDDFQKVNIVIPKINTEAALENQQQL